MSMWCSVQRKAAVDKVIAETSPDYNQSISPARYVADKHSRLQPSVKAADKDAAYSLVNEKCGKHVEKLKCLRHDGSYGTGSCNVRATFGEGSERI